MTILVVVLSKRIMLLLKIIVIELSAVVVVVFFLRINQARFVSLSIQLVVGSDCSWCRDVQSSFPLRSKQSSPSCFVFQKLSCICRLYAVDWKCFIILVCLKISFDLPYSVCFGIQERSFSSHEFLSSDLILVLSISRDSPHLLFLLSSSTFLSSYLDYFFVDFWLVLVSFFSIQHVCMSFHISFGLFSFPLNSSNVVENLLCVCVWDPRTVSGIFYVSPGRTWICKCFSCILKKNKSRTNTKQYSGLVRCLICSRSCLCL